MISQLMISSSSSSKSEDAPPTTWFAAPPAGTGVDQSPRGPIATLAVVPDSDVVETSLECRLCGIKRKNFYCADCSSRGDFFHSGRGTGRNQNVMAGNLNMKKCEETQLLRTKMELGQQIKKMTANKTSTTSKREDMMLCKQRIKYLKHLVEDRKRTLERSKEDSTKLGSVNDIRRRRLPLFQDKVTKISGCVDQYKNDLNQGIKKCMVKRKELDCLRSKYCQKLQKIFPIRPSSPNTFDSRIQENPLETIHDPNLMSTDDDLIAEAMADAMSTSYIQGRWVTTSAFKDTTSESGDEAGGDEFKILDARLPANGDYSAFPALVSASHSSQVVHLVPTMMSSSLDLNNEVATISAALTFVSQLLSHLYSFWDEVPPSKPHPLGEFGIPTSSQYKFAKKVARLNLNLIYLCLKLGVSPDDLKATRTLHNLHKLLETFNSGISTSTLPFPCHEYEKLALENYQAELEGLSPSSEDLEEEEDCEIKDLEDEDEWEAVSTGISEAMTVHLPQSSMGFMTSLMRGFSNQ